MKTEKVSLKNIAAVLSREEMKKIMAGSGTCSVRCDQNSSETEDVTDCERETIKEKCGEDISNAVCICG